MISEIIIKNVIEHNTEILKYFFEILNLYLFSNEKIVLRIFEFRISIRTVCLNA